MQLVTISFFGLPSRIEDLSRYTSDLMMLRNHLATSVHISEHSYSRVRDE